MKIENQMNEKQNEKQKQKLKSNEKPKKIKNEMGRKKNKIKKQFLVCGSNLVSRIFMSNDLRLRPFGHDNWYNPKVLIVGIENVRAL